LNQPLSYSVSPCALPTYNGQVGLAAPGGPHCHLQERRAAQGISRSASCHIAVWQAQQRSARGRGVMKSAVTALLVIEPGYPAPGCAVVAGGEVL